MFFRTDFSSLHGFQHRQYDTFEITEDCFVKILLCNNSYDHAEEKLAALLPDHEVHSCAPNEVAKHLDGVDVVIPSVASIDSSIIHAGQFGLIQL